MEHEEANLSSRVSRCLKSEARWVMLEYSSGKMLADDTRQLRKENGDLLRSQPEKVSPGPVDRIPFGVRWKWLAERAGLLPHNDVFSWPCALGRACRVCVCVYI